MNGNTQRKIRIGSFLAFCMMVLSTLGCQSESTVKVIKFGHSLDVTHPVHKSIVYFGDRLNAHSEGKMRLEIYPSGQLGNERELIELLQIGSLSMTKVSATPLASFVPEMKVFSLPYVFRDNDHLWQVLTGHIGREILRATSPYFIYGLGYFDSGSRSFYTKEKPVLSPVDLRGQKIRVMQSQDAVAMVEALGGSATPVSFGELYTALQLGVVDGAENNPPSFYTSKHYEVAKYYSMDEHTSIPDVLLISKHTWDSLSEQQQQWLQTALDESITYQRKIWQAASDEALAAVIAAGVEVVYPDKAQFQDAVSELYRKYEADDAATMKIFASIQEVGDD